jgi:signal transduction histidine kinase
MQERVRQLSGSISFDSAPGKGFRIAVQLPLSVIAPDSQV